MNEGALDKYKEAIKTQLRKIYSETVAEHATSPRNMGDLENYSSFGIIIGPCGDTMAIWLKVDDGIISEASFTTDGCTTTIASGSMITEMAKGKTVGQAQEIGQRDVLDALQNLPEESQHCALLAANTLQEAIKDYLASATPS